MYLTEFISKKSSRIECEPKFESQFDVVVVGMGTAGAIAAIAAAEQGVTVCAVEKLNLPGGTATSGGIAGYYYGLPGGRFEELDNRAEQLRSQAFLQGGGFHVDAKGIVLEQAFESAGGTLLYESSVTGVFLADDGKTVIGVRAVTPDGVRDIGCKVAIDGTGNGDLCALAGAEFTEGRESDAQPQPFSSVRVFLNPEQKMASANFDAGYTVSSDAAELNRAIIASNALHCYPPGCETAPQRLFYITQLPGHREARLVRCDHLLSGMEIIEKKFKHQALGWSFSNFDSHSLDWAFEDDLACDWMVPCSLWAKAMVAPITLEILIVKGFRNLMVIGRAVGVDHFSASLLRMERCMEKTGEIAGLAAALTVRDGKEEVREVDRDALEKLVRASGCLDESILPRCEFPTAHWAEDFATDKPGDALWYASRHLETTRGKLLELLDSGDRNVAAHAAIALAMGSDPAGAPVLRRMIRERDDFLQTTGRRHNYPRIYAEAYLLGRVGEPGDAALLLELARERAADYHPFSYAWRGALTLGDRFPETRAEIAAALCEILEAPDFTLPFLFKNVAVPSQAFHEPMQNMFRLVTALRLREWGVPNRLAESLTGTLTWREKRLLKQLKE